MKRWYISRKAKFETLLLFDIFVVQLFAMFWFIGLIEVKFDIYPNIVPDPLFVNLWLIYAIVFFMTTWNHVIDFAYPKPCYGGRIG